MRFVWGREKWKSFLFYACKKLLAHEGWRFFFFDMSGPLKRKLWLMPGPRKSSCGKIQARCVQWWPFSFFFFLSIILCSWAINREHLACYESVNMVFAFPHFFFLSCYPQVQDYLSDVYLWYKGYLLVSACRGAGPVPNQECWTGYASGANIWSVLHFYT